MIPGRLLARRTEMVTDYEQLRSAVLDQPRGSVLPPGLALFLRQGMTAWMRAWTGCSRENQGEASCPLPAGRLSLSVRTEMTLILAGIILGQQREITV
jgi:hypothetical protein